MREDIGETFKLPAIRLFRRQAQQTAGDGEQKRCIELLRFLPRKGACQGKALQKERTSLQFSAFAFEVIERLRLAIPRGALLPVERK